ncbi:carboxypeptidase-like regulatory domain-containing protein [Polyangium sorediatum]|uniref:Carboxypeptidase-like regulatory domain-containing protein n=1 Tax=Polyangium sorediatum TaxID=889274 RepID=A0ABT6P3M1_9BACT|nr:carboxypeptidase-like regulatory domain-containing protein [Polyangium sorediatum]MDI1434840.1 carboxypeptidase-like regulatory domain-containing protein [Polyangium sorediatum]
MWHPGKHTRLASASIVVTAAIGMLSGCGENEPAGVGGAGGQGAAGSVSSSSSSAVVGPTTGAGGALPEVFPVTGVVTDGTSPLPGAIVMQGGGAPALVTGPDGAFSIELSTSIPGAPTVVAAKVGYRSAGIEFDALPEGPIELVLHEAAPPDNADGYKFGPPGVGDENLDATTALCGHCHTTLVAQFQQSAHAKATRDPLVQDLYAGTSRAHGDAASCAAAGGEWRTGRVPGSMMGTAPRCYLGSGVLPDLNGCGAKGALACDDPALPAAEKPTAFGACADCHAAGLDGKAGGRDLLEATGIAFDNGNHCDTCHKVRDIDLTKPPGTAGRLLLQRPSETVSNDPLAKLRQVMFGPLPDVPNEFMGGSYQPKFSEATFCAGCHEQAQPALLPGQMVDPARFPDGLPVHSTFAEWSSSPWAEAGAPCQHCHMPPNEGLWNTLDKTTPKNGGITFGFVRPPEQIRSHAFRGPLAGTPRLLDLALGMWMTAKAAGGGVDVSVTLSNQGCGHALPTGEPMRSLVLVLRAEACGEVLVASAGPTVPDVGGAWAEGVIGQGVAVVGTSWSWPEGAAHAKPGQVLRVVRETGNWLDYPGIGVFADPTLSPADKGIPIRVPVAEAKVVSAANGQIVTAGMAEVMPGDRVFLGDGLAAEVMDGSGSAALAGAPGQAFARVLVDAEGKRFVPHYRAVDMASDSRLPPFTKVTSQHSFVLPAGCPGATVTATALYRPVPVGMAKERGWEARDWVVAARKEVVSAN